MNIPARLGIGVPSAAALSILVLFGADMAGVGAETPPPPPPPVEEETVDPPPPPPAEEEEGPVEEVVPPPEEEEVVEEEVPPPAPPEPQPLDFDHLPPGDLIDGTVHILADEGIDDPTVISPDMRFPVLTGPAYSNSQIFNPIWSWDFYPHTGDIDGVKYPRPSGPENTPSNFAYPWQDNFCEIRSQSNARCPEGIGHRGIDIRPGACWHNQVVVAAASGQLRTLSAFSVDLFGDDGMVYRYFHVDRPLIIDLEPGEWIEVEAGDPIGFLSDVSSTTLPVQRNTSIHLHFELWEGDLSGADPRNPYTSLIESYRWLGAESPANHTPMAELGDCTYPDGGLTPTRADVLAALEAAEAAEESE